MNLEGVVAHGNTDTGILRDALTLARIDPAQWRPAIPSALDAMVAFVRDRETDMRVTPIDGARQVLVHLRQKGALLGVATGNLRGIGEIKLRLGGYADSFSFAGFSDGLENRAAVFARAIDELRKEYPGRRSTCIVGDTPMDVQAAHENGLAVIAVATGIFKMEELVIEGPEYCVSSLLDLLR